MASSNERRFSRPKARVNLLVGSLFSVFCKCQSLRVTMGLGGGTGPLSGTGVFSSESTFFRRSFVGLPSLSLRRFSTVVSLRASRRLESVCLKGPHCKSRLELLGSPPLPGLKKSSYPRRAGCISPFHLRAKRRCLPRAGWLAFRPMESEAPKPVRGARRCSTGVYLPIEAAKLAPRWNEQLAIVHERELKKGDRNRFHGRTVSA